MYNTRKFLCGEIKAFLADSGMPKSTFGQLAVGDKSLVARLVDGHDITTGKLDRIRIFIALQRAEHAARESGA